MKKIFEYSYIDNKKLENYIKENKYLHRYFEASFEGIKSTKYCGIINFENEDYYILPKIAKDKEEKNLNIFIYMLLYAYDIKLSNEEIGNSANEQKTIFEAFIQIFCKKSLF